MFLHMKSMLQCPTQLKTGVLEGRNVLFNDTINTFYFTVIWHRTYGK